MHLCLFEDAAVSHLHPLVDTRAAFDLRLGARTLLETIRDAVQPDGLILHTRPLVEGVTAQAHPNALIRTLPDGADVLFWNARAVAHPGPVIDELRFRLATDDTGFTLSQGDTLVAAFVPNAAASLPKGALHTRALGATLFDGLPAESISDIRLVSQLWNLLDDLRDTIRTDIQAATAEQAPQPALSDRADVSVHPSAIVVNPEQIVTEPGATVRPGAILNAEDGPILLGRDAVIHERAVVRGPCVIGPNSHVKIGADVEGCAFGYYCKVGGEVHGTVIHSLSNKGHAGFLGDSYLGRWCNLGADTNTSNLKNDYGSISAYDPAEGAFVDTRRQFLGLVMGDHSKCGINTMFNTGTVVGTFCNLFGGGFPPRYVPAFSWGSPGTGFAEYRLEKALRVAEAVLARRDTPLTDADRTLLTRLFDQTAPERARRFG